MSIVQAAGVEIDQTAVLKALKLNPADANTQAALLVCQKYGFDPVLKHVVVIPGAGLYVTRDGLLHVAHRSGQFDGIEVLDVGVDQTHHWAKVAVYRKDMSHPFTYVGRYPKNGGNPKYAPEMAVKCAEVMALRRAFDVTGVPAVDERWDVDQTEDDDSFQPGPRPDMATADAVADIGLRVRGLSDEWRSVYNERRKEQQIPTVLDAHRWTAAHRDAASSLLDEIGDEIATAEAPFDDPEPAA